MNNKIGISVIVILFLAKFLIQPWFEWVNLTTLEVNQKEKSYLKLSALGEKQEQALLDINKLKSELAPFDDKRLPPSKSKITTITLDYIKQLGVENDVKIVNQRLGEIQKGTLSYIPLEMFIEGNPVSLTQFLHSIEQGKYMMVTAQANIVKTLRNPDLLTVNLTLYIAIKEG